MPLHVHRNGQPGALRDELERLTRDDGAVNETNDLTELLHEYAMARGLRRQPKGRRGGLR